MTDEQVFIDSCLTDPDTELPKLVFADWLEEHGRTTEAWRIRQYVRVYRPAWLAVLDWDATVDWRQLERLTRQVIDPRSDELWRLVFVTLLDGILQRYPLSLERFTWQDGWNPDRYRNVLATVNCRVILVACGIEANLALAEQTILAAAEVTQDPEWDSAWYIARALRLATREIQASSGPSVIAGDGAMSPSPPWWPFGWGSVGAQVANGIKEAINAAREAAGHASAGTREQAWAAEERAGDQALSAAYSLWTHIHDTSPTW